MSRNEAVITLTGKDNGALRMFQQLDESERKQLMRMLELKREVAQLEIAQKRQGTEAERAAQRTAQAYEQAARRMRVTSSTVTHLSAMHLPPSLRAAVPGRMAMSAYETQLLAQFNPLTAGGAATAMMQPILAKQQMLQRMQATADATNRRWEGEFQQSQKSMSMGQIVASAHGTVKAQYLADMRAIVERRAGIANFNGEDAMMRGARERVARHIQRVPDLAAKITAEEFDAMSHKMREKMETSLNRHRGFWMASIPIIYGASRVVTGVSDAEYGLQAGAGQRAIAGAAGRRELRQIAESGTDFRAMTLSVDSFRLATGMDESAAAKAVFAAKSAGYDPTKLGPLMGRLKDINLSPDVALAAAQKMRDNFGDRAGSLEAILDKFIIGAGPSPAGIADLAGGVGTSAAAFQAIGGKPNDLVAMLGILTTRLKDSSAASEYAKSVSNQLSKKAANIRWGAGEKPLQGLDLIANLERLGKENRLLDDRGRPTDYKNFLGEMLAVNAADQIRAASGAIKSQSRQMDVADTLPGSVMKGRASLLDLKADTAKLAEKATQKRQHMEEKTFAPMFNLAEAVMDRELSQELDTKKRGDLLAVHKTFAEWTRKGWTGSSQESFVRERLKAGTLTSEERRLYFASQLDTVPLQIMQTELNTRGKWNIADDGRFGSFATPTAGRAPQTLGGLLAAAPVTAGGAGRTPAPDARPMTKEEADDYERALRQQIRLKQQGPPTDGKSILAGLPSFDQMYENFATFVSPKFGGFVAQQRAIGGAFDNMVTGYMGATGLTRDDYRVRILDKIVRDRRGESMTMMTGAALKNGGDFEAVRPEIIQRLNEIAPTHMQEVYTANMDFIDVEKRRAQEAFDNAPNDATRDFARARLKYIEGRIRQAYRDGDGRMTATDAQAIRDDIAPGETAMGKLATAVEGIGNQLGQILDKLPGKNDAKTTPIVRVAAEGERP